MFVVYYFISFFLGDTPTSINIMFGSDQGSNFQPSYFSKLSTCQEVLSDLSIYLTVLAHDWTVRDDMTPKQDIVRGYCITKEKL